MVLIVVIQSTQNVTQTYLHTMIELNHEPNVEKRCELMYSVLYTILLLYIWSIPDEEYMMNSTADWRRCRCPFGNVCITQLLYVGSVFVLFH